MHRTILIVSINVLCNRKFRWKDSMEGENLQKNHYIYNEYIDEMSWQNQSLKSGNVHTSDLLHSVRNYNFDEVNFTSKIIIGGDWWQRRRRGVSLSGSTHNFFAIYKTLFCYSQNLREISLCIKHEFQGSNIISSLRWYLPTLTVRNQFHDSQIIVKNSKNVML